VNGSTEELLEPKRRLRTAYAQLQGVRDDLHEAECNFLEACGWDEVGDNSAVWRHPDFQNEAHSYTLFSLKHALAVAEALLNAGRLNEGKSASQPAVAVNSIDPLEGELRCWICEKVINRGMAVTTDEKDGRVRHVVGSPACRAGLDRQPIAKPPTPPDFTSEEEVTALLNPKTPEEKCLRARAILEHAFKLVGELGVEVRLPFQTVGGLQAWSQQIKGPEQLQLKIQVEEETA